MDGRADDLGGPASAARNLAGRPVMRHLNERRGGAKRDGGGIRLSAVLPEARFIACDDVVVTRCSDVAARCRPGDAFVARLTPRGDGHDEVAVALARGASAVVADRMVATDGLPLCLVPDSSAAHARIAQALVGNPSRELRLITVAGTSGKTTTAWLAAAVLAEAGHRVGVLTDLGCLGPDDTEPSAADLAAPTVLAGWLARLAAAGCSHAILEASSGALAAQALAGVTSDTVVVTNTAAAHLDAHGTAAAYRRILARAAATLGDGGCLVSGAGPGDTRRLGHACPDATVIRAGLDAACGVRAVAVERSLSGRTFLLAAGGQMVPVTADTPTVGFVRDAALAAAIGMRHGMSLELIGRGIEAAGSVPGRVERIDRGQDAAVFVDSPSSMHAVAATLASLRRLTSGRLVVVAERKAAAALAGRGFVGRLGRWADEALVVPEGIAAADAGSTDLAAYARLDRLLGSLARGDCAVVIGPAGLRGGSGPRGGMLALVVDGWLQLAHPAEAPFAGRRAA
jgi:UDP-N-acetylmuramoyl-L-alanyl-D-glutamate--2,6-diaminopimelate ligase